MNIILNNKPIQTLRMARAYVDLDQNNRKDTACRDCGIVLETGAGVYRSAYMGMGFICFNCLRADMLARTHDRSFPGGDAGFRTGKGSALVQCVRGEIREFTARQVLEVIRSEWKYEIAERLIGHDPVFTQRLIDASDSIA
jgi:hypothetical protein